MRHRTDPLIYELARALYAARVADAEPDVRNEIAYQAARIDRVNAYLVSHLYRERLYQLVTESRNIGPVNKPDLESWGRFAIVRVYLKDGQSRALELEDVGSGLPYVIPVLFAISGNGLMQMQQPELHLHPALQAALGDILAERLQEASGEGTPLGWTIIIETHSEHILLRLLNTVRQHTLGRPGALPLSASDLSVYYFDPKVDGGTDVSLQLVSPMGDFFAEWPRGFFPERDAELRKLFDE